jgi:hypothetical protein
MVGMTTRVRVLESAGIASTSTEVYWRTSSPLFPCLHLDRLAWAPFKMDDLIAQGEMCLHRSGCAPSN